MKKILATCLVFVLISNFAFALSGDNNPADILLDSTHTLSMKIIKWCRGIMKNKNSQYKRKRSFW